jgi:hypothetical protein
MQKRLVVRSEAVVLGTSGSKEADAAEPALRLDSSGISVAGGVVLELDPGAVLSIPQAADVFGAISDSLMSLPVSDDVIDASHTFEPITFSKFDASAPLPVGLGGTGIGSPTGGAALVGNGTGPLSSVPELRLGDPSGASSLDVAGGIRLAEVDGQGNATGGTFAISSTEDGWGRPALVMERQGGERIDVASPLRSVGPVVASVELVSAAGDARVYGVAFEAYRPSRVFLAAFLIDQAPALATPVTAMRVATGYRAVASGGGDVSAAQPLAGQGGGAGVSRSAYYTSHSLTVTEGFLGTIACVVTDLWGNMSAVYELGA